MLFNYLALAATALLGVASAMPSSLVKRVDSPDGTCALTRNSMGYRCPGTSCCSRYGNCGTTLDYCGTGCQSAYGTCSTTTQTTDSFVCGPQNNNLICNSNKCCSKYGNCGTTDAHCAASAGCQSAFGRCTTATASSTTSPATSSTTTSSTATPTSTIPVSTNNKCGIGFGTRCPDTQCCSEASNCGTTADHCRSPGCQRDFGRCDADVMPAGGTTAGIARPKIGNVPYGQTIQSCTGGAHKIALTFDDGPYTYTAELLDMLASYNFKATFFITGINLAKGSIDTVAQWISVIQRAANEGHQIAHHTWSHDHLNAISPTRFDEEILKNEMALRNILGKFPTYMRPPYGECNADCQVKMGTLGYHVITWDVDTNDWLYNTPATNQQSKDIVRGFIQRTDVEDWLPLMHDIQEQTVHNLSSYTFDLMVQNGWTSTTVGECLGDPVANWYRAA